MSKEKQIEEMSSEIREAVNGCSSYWSEVIAEHLFEQGYRKQSEGEWKLGKSGCMYFCDKCGYAAHPREEEWNYCPNCGAKMRKEDEGK